MIDNSSAGCGSSAAYTRNQPLIVFSEGLFGFFMRVHAESVQPRASPSECIIGGFSLGPVGREKGNMLSESVAFLSFLDFLFFPALSASNMGQRFSQYPWGGRGGLSFCSPSFLSFRDSYHTRR